MEYYSVIKNGVLPFSATWMDLDNNILREVSRERQILYNFYVESKNIIQINLFTNQKQTCRQRKQTCGYQTGKGRRRD